MSTAGCYSQFDGEVFHIIFAARQRDGERGIQVLLLEFVDEANLELIVIYCGGRKMVSKRCLSVCTFMLKTS